MSTPRATSTLNARHRPADSDACNPVANDSGEHWNTTGADRRLLGRGDLRRRRRGLGNRRGLLPQPREPRRRRHAEPAEPLPGPARRLTYASSPPSSPNNPLVLDSVKANATRRTGDFQTTSERWLRGVHQQAGAEPAGTPTASAAVYRFEAGADQLDCAPATGPKPKAPASSPTPNCRPTASPARRRPPLLHDRRPAASSTTPTARRTSTSGAEGRPQLISTGTGPFDSGPARPSPPTAPTSSSSPTTTSPRRRQQRRADEDLRRPRRRRLLQAAAGGALPGLRRVPRPRHPGRPARRHQELRQNHPGQRPRLPQEPGQEARPVREEAAQRQEEARTRRRRAPPRSEPPARTESGVVAMRRALLIPLLALLALRSAPLRPRRR